MNNTPDNKTSKETKEDTVFPVEATGQINVTGGPVTDDAVQEGFLQSPTTPQERRRGLQVLFASLIAVGMGQSLVFTILPPLAREIGMHEWQVSSIFALSAFCWVFSSAYWGDKSDHWGRKKAMLIGTAGYTVSMFLFAGSIKVAQLALLPLSVAFALMIGTRAIFGVFGSSTNPAANAYVADRTTPGERAAGLGLLGAAFGVGGILGPGVAGAFSAIDLLAPIYFVAFLGLCSFLAILKLLPERTRPTPRARTPFWTLLNDRRVLPFVLFGMGLSVVQSTTVQTITFYFMDRIGFSPKEAAQFVAVAFMASALAALFSQLFVVQRFGLSTRALMRGGTAVGILTYVLFIFIPEYSVLTLAMVLQGFAFGMIRPGHSAAASLAVASEEQGAVAGLLGGTGAVGHIIAPVIVAVFYQGVGPQSVYWLCLGLMLLLLVTLYVHPAFKVILEHRHREVVDRPEA
ncbi:MAG: MFS transporter [Alphaproteobacteria bacterium]|nr:MAG: MFS transporter [Alphaproteobacteria bacterium]